MLNVAVGIVLNNKSEVLITQRGGQQNYSDFWEFPGGKIERHETPAHALCRELQEEIAISCVKYHHWITHDYKYPEYDVRLEVFFVQEFDGAIVCQESQKGFKWVKPEQLKNIQFLEGNGYIINQLLTLS